MGRELLPEEVLRLQGLRGVRPATDLRPALVHPHAVAGLLATAAGGPARDLRLPADGEAGAQSGGDPSGRLSAVDYRAARSCRSFSRYGRAVALSTCRSSASASSRAPALA